MFGFIKQLFSKDQIIYGKARHPHWRAVRQKHIEEFPYCAVCGCTTNLQVHHILPFHKFPEHELNPDNLITLGVKCRSGNHHYLFGHYQDWHDYNASVRRNTSEFLRNIKGK